MYQQLPDVITKFPEVGFMSNSYLIEADDSYTIIDASVPPTTFLNKLKDRSKPLTSIILTHGHYDHIAEIDNYRRHEAFHDCQVKMHAKESAYLQSTSMNVSQMFECPSTFNNNDVNLHDGDVLNLGSNLRLHVWHTPGHTLGSICLLLTAIDKGLCGTGATDTTEVSKTAAPSCQVATPSGSTTALPCYRRQPLEIIKPDENPLALFTGDTVIGLSIGRTDFPGGDYSVMLQTLEKLKQRLEALPADLPILCGHGDVLTAAYCLQHNGWFKLMK